MRTAGDRGCTISPASGTCATELPAVGAGRDSRPQAALAARSATDNKQQLGQKRDHRPLPYHTPARHPGLGFRQAQPAILATATRLRQHTRDFLSRAHTESKSSIKADASAIYVGSGLG